MNFNTFSLNYWAMSSHHRGTFIFNLGLNDASVCGVEQAYDRYCGLDNDSAHITRFLPLWFGHESNVFDKTGQLIKSDACDWMKDYPVYFRLYDNQTGRYMATGYNATSKEELAQDWVQYKSIDFEDEDHALFATLSPQAILEVAFEQGFEVVASETPFEEQDY